MRERYNVAAAAVNRNFKMVFMGPGKGASRRWRLINWAPIAASAETGPLRFAPQRRNALNFRAAVVTPGHQGFDLL